MQNDVATLKKDLTGVQKKVQDLSSKVIDGPDGTSKVVGFDETTIAGDPSKSATDAASETPSGTGPAAARSAGAVSGTEEKAPSGVASVTSKKTASQSSVSAGHRAAAKGRTASGVNVASEEFDDEKMARCMEAVRSVEATYADALRDLDSRVADLEKEMGCVTDRINSESGMGLDGGGGVADLVAKIQAIQADMEKMNQTASRLMDDKENRETHTSVRDELTRGI